MIWKTFKFVEIQESWLVRCVNIYILVRLWVWGQVRDMTKRGLWLLFNEVLDFHVASLPPNHAHSLKGSSLAGLSLEDRFLLTCKCDGPTYSHNQFCVSQSVLYQPQQLSPITLLSLSSHFWFSGRKLTEWRNEMNVLSPVWFFYISVY